MNDRLEGRHFPYLPLRLQVQGRTFEVEAMIDTGFDGDITVPAHLVSNERPDDRQRWTLADGSRVYAPYFLGSLQVGDFAPVEAIITALGEEPLVGRSITDRFRLTLDHGERVIVEV